MIFKPKAEILKDIIYLLRSIFNLFLGYNL
jgi:hypothetical protein